MRSLSVNGKLLVKQAMPGAPVEDLKAFWIWANGESDGYLLAAYLIVGFCGASEQQGFEGFDAVGRHAHPVRILFALDEDLRTMIGEFILNPFDCIFG